MSNPTVCGTAEKESQRRESGGRRGIGNVWGLAASEIVEDFEVALEQFREIATDLGANGGRV
jgi:hypothetical protein